METFKIIKGFENYAISKSGQVKNIKTQKILNRVEAKGALHVYIFRDKKQHDRLVSRLLATEFISNPNNFKYVGYKDGNSMNINISNLEWVQDTRKVKYGNYQRLNCDYVWLENIKKLEKENMSKIGM